MKPIRFIPRASILLALLVVIGLVVAAATIGPAHIGFVEAIRILFQRVPVLGRLVEHDWSSAHETIIWKIRFPRILLAALVGAALGVSGTAFQVLLKNPMADPYIIGVSSGASLGAAVGIVSGISSNGPGVGWLPVLAFIGATLTVWIVYRLARIGHTLPVTGLLLAGVAVGAFATAGVSLLMVMRTDDMQKVFLWLLGSFSGRSWVHVSVIWPYVAIGTGYLLSSARTLNVLLMGEESAQTLGIDVERTKVTLMFVGALVAAAAVSVSGVIGFVGLIVPHAVRLIVGPDHRRVVPMAAVVGAAFLIVADTAARTLLAPRELPVGIVTALFGAPFFLYLLRKRSREGYDR